MGTTLTKFKRTELPAVRKELMHRQNGVCPICGKDLTRVAVKNLVVDHDHKTGVVRAVMHRGCNGLEGKVLRLLTTWGKASSLVEAKETLCRLIGFWDRHRTPQTDWIYYNHKTQAEKKTAYNKKRRKLYAKKKNR